MSEGERRKSREEALVEEEDGEGIETDGEVIETTFKCS